jgi:transposase
LLSTQELTGPQIAERVGCTEPTVVLWRRRFVEGGLAGLEDRVRKPPPRTTVTDEVRDEILTATLTRPPAELGITQGSSRLLAQWLRRSGTRVSHDSISRLWHQFGIQPWRCETCPVTGSRSGAEAGTLSAFVYSSADDHRARRVLDTFVATRYDFRVPGTRPGSS